MRASVSIPDELFRRADELARRLGKSRSEVYREALADYMSRREPGSVTASLDAVVEELGGSVDDWVLAAGYGALQRSHW